MARGSLLRMLQQSARRVRESHRGPVATDVDHRRRRILTQAAVLAGSAWLPASLAATPRIASTAPRAIVIGGGLAGLCAVDALASARVDVVLHEASPLLGGRCYSERTAFADGQVAERGGELIDTGHSEIRALAASLGLQLDDLSAAEAAGALPVVRFADGIYPLSEIDRRVTRRLPSLRRASATSRDDGAMAGLSQWRCGKRPARRTRGRRRARTSHASRRVNAARVRDGGRAPESPAAVTGRAARVIGASSERGAMSARRIRVLACSGRNPAVLRRDRPPPA